jgi:hypothetical protein
MSPGAGRENPNYGAEDEDGDSSEGDDWKVRKPVITFENVADEEDTEKEVSISEN